MYTWPRLGGGHGREKGIEPRPIASLDVAERLGKPGDAANAAAPDSCTAGQAIQGPTNNNQYHWSHGQNSQGKSKGILII